MYVGACDGVCNGMSSVIIQRRTHTLIGKTLESGLQAAVSWASLLCVYMVAMAISELHAKYFVAIEFPICIYRQSSLEGQGPPNVYIGGGGFPPNNAVVFTRVSTVERSLCMRVSATVDRLLSNCFARMVTPHTKSSACMLHF